MNTRGTIKHIFIVAYLMFFVFSCSVEKRKYRGGYYFQRSSSTKQTPALVREEFVPLKKINTTFPAFSDTQATEAKKVPVAAERRETVCDTLYMKSGAKLIVKVTNINKEKIHYLQCDSDNEAEFYIETSSAKKVCYANGLTDELKNPQDAPYDYTQGQNTWTQQNNDKSPELDKVAKNTKISLGLVLAGLILYPLATVGFIMAIIQRKKLKGKKGYESAYRRANVLSIIAMAAAGLLLFIILLSILLI